MEEVEKQCLVKELDLTLQPRTAPRYKAWLPLVTQQLRLRSLIQIFGHKFKNDGKSSCLFYYTIHRTSMSSPLYSSELIDGTSPRWASLEEPILHRTGHANSSEIILRVWKRIIKDDPSTDITVFTWGISFTGLDYIGFKLPSNLDSILNENSIIFHLHGGFFVPPFCLCTSSSFKKFLTLSVNISEVKESYTVGKLCSLRSKMQALKQETDSVKNLREKIASGESLNSPKYPQSSLNRLLQPKKVNKEKKAEIVKIKNDLEVAKFRTKLLDQERVKKMGEVRSLNQCHLELVERNQDHGSDLMERYQQLNKDIEKLYEWRQNQTDSKEIYVQTTSALAVRTRQLISGLDSIYPIIKDQEDRYLINDVHLPDSEKLETANDTQVAVALGFVAHTTQMIANFLNVPTRYPIMHYGSRSKIIDHIQEHLPDSNRQFPLYARSKDKLHFNYAVYLLNKNIAQLRWYCGFPTADLRATLLNLSGLINIKQNYNSLDSSKKAFSGSSLEAESNKSNMPLTPPMRKATLGKSYKISQSIGRFKGRKTLLGSSLDQGLNKPEIQFRHLNKHIKRICKSEDSAIYDDAMSMSSNMCVMSNDTLTDPLLDFKNHSVNKTNYSTGRGDDVCNATLAADDIEILVPMSVCKSAFGSDSTLSPITSRQRSSNSISSCEMALGSSLVEEEDSSNGHSSIKTDDCIFVKQEKNSDCISVACAGDERAEKCNESFIKKATDLNHPIKNKDNCDNKQIKPPDNVEKSCAEVSTNCDTNLRETGETAKILEPSTSQVDSLPHKISSADDCDLSFPERVENNEEKDFAASNEYMDSIRRSSENVYARTEALANNPTSFKVMKPRL